MSQTALLREIKSEALAQAVKVGGLNAAEIVTAAKAFEEYLKGEEE